jgi:outer membrane protein
MRVRPLQAHGISLFLLGLSLTVAQDLSTNNPNEIKLTLESAESYALVNHPAIQAETLTALAVGQTIRESRSEYYPQLKVEANAVGAPDNTRLAALDSLNNPSIYSRQSEGLVGSQLITDFGRTSNLTSSAKFSTRAAENRVSNTRAMVIKNVDRAYFEYLRAESLLRVAQKTLDARQLELEQVQALASSQLKSDLDVSFAQESLSELDFFC